jgi:hypothetical protein
MQVILRSSVHFILHILYRNIYFIQGYCNLLCNVPFSLTLDNNTNSACISDDGYVYQEKTCLNDFYGFILIYTSAQGARIT